MRNYDSLPNFLKRRLSFIVSELKSDDPKYDQSISILLRAISNIATVGFDGGSFAIKCANPRTSLKALQLRKELQNDKLWASSTINEHPTPLRHMWGLWLKYGNEISEQIVWEYLLKHPMITITTEEDQNLRKIHKENPMYAIEDRYKLASIQVI